MKQEKIKKNENPKFGQVKRLILLENLIISKIKKKKKTRGKAQATNNWNECITNDPMDIQNNRETL